MGTRLSILAEDTRGLHKVKHVRAGHRLMLQPQFSGTAYSPARFGPTLDSLPGLARHPALRTAEGAR